METNIEHVKTKTKKGRKKRDHGRIYIKYDFYYH